MDLSILHGDFILSVNWPFLCFTPLFSLMSPCLSLKRLRVFFQIPVFCRLYQCFWSLWLGLGRPSVWLNRSGHEKALGSTWPRRQRFKWLCVFYRQTLWSSKSSNLERLITESEWGIHKIDQRSSNKWSNTHQNYRWTTWRWNLLGKHNSFQRCLKITWVCVCVCVCQDPSNTSTPVNTQLKRQQWESNHPKNIVSS